MGGRPVQFRKRTVVSTCNLSVFSFARARRVRYMGSISNRNALAQQLDPSLSWVCIFERNPIKSRRIWCVVTCAGFSKFIE